MHDTLCHLWVLSCCYNVSILINSLNSRNDWCSLLLLSLLWLLCSFNSFLWWLIHLRLILAKSIKEYMVFNSLFHSIHWHLLYLLHCHNFILNWLWLRKCLLILIILCIFITNNSRLFWEAINYFGSGLDTIRDLITS